MIEKRRHIDENGYQRTQYKRLCTCGDEKWTSYKPKEGTLCSSCSSRRLMYEISQNNIKKPEDRLSYEATCNNCLETRYLKRKNTGRLCGDCNRKMVRKYKISIYYDLDKMVLIAPTKFYRTCINCNDVRQVSSKANSGDKLCLDCSRASSKRPKSNKTKSRQVSKEAINSQRAINKAYREAQNIKEPIPIAKLRDEEMMSVWLLKNDITVCPSANDFTYHKMNVSESHGGEFI